MEQTLKYKIHRFLDVTKQDSLGNFLSKFIMFMIALNVLAVILETIQCVHSAYSAYFLAFERFSVAVFTLEYLLRLWTCTLEERFKRPVLGRGRFILTPFPLIDLVAILPFYLSGFGMAADLRFIRAMRLLRLLKLGQHSQSLKTLGNVFRKKSRELGITAFVGVIMLIVASSAMYFAEHEAQPRVFSSIPEAMWWGVITLTTVGYGDIYPVTTLGKLISGVIAFMGIAMVALPSGILGSGFMEEIQSSSFRDAACPHCGERIQ